MITSIGYSENAKSRRKVLQQYLQDHYGKKHRNHSGSIILEMAISVPIMLMVSLIILISINCVRADILFTQAVDQVTGEAAIAVPVFDTGLDLVSGVLSHIGCENEESSTEDSTYSGVAQALGFVNALADYIGIEGEDVFGTLVFGKVIRDRIMVNYDQLCEENVIYRSIENVSVYIDYDRPGGSIYLDVYYEWSTPFGNYDKVIHSSVPVYGDLVLSLESEDQEDDSIWSKSNFERGLYFRSLYGANLPRSFPVLSVWKNGTAKSIKSIDLTAPTYQSGNGLEKKVMSHINDLAEYRGTSKPWGEDKIFIDGRDIDERVLILIIPKNAPDSTITELNRYCAYAESLGVELVYKKHGVSDRYQENEEDESGDSESNADIEQ
ncbi:MAG: hypothetical protein JW780_02015 [Clostridiales bacterium]|nr:hypothetical protein [Clostridiales bacterium]